MQTQQAHPKDPAQEALDILEDAWSYYHPVALKPVAELRESEDTPIVAYYEAA